MNVFLSSFALFEPPDQLPSLVWYNAMLLPSFILLFGAIFYLGGRYNDIRLGKSTPTRWAGALLVAISLYLGFLRFMWTTDMMYGQLVRTSGKKFLAAHYTAFFLPLIGALVIVFLEWWDRKQKQFIE